MKMQRRSTNQRALTLAIEFSLLLLAATIHSSVAQSMSVAYSEVAQVSITDQPLSMHFDSDAWQESVGSPTVKKTATLHDALRYTLSFGASVTAQVTGVSGAATDFSGETFDAVDSIRVIVEKGHHDGTSDSSAQLWVNDASGDRPAEAKVVVQTVSGEFGRSSDSDFGEGGGASVTYEVTIDVEQGHIFQDSEFEVTFTAMGAL